MVYLSTKLKLYQIKVWNKGCTFFDGNEHVVLEFTSTETQNSHVLPAMHDAHERLFFVRIPYQEFHKNTASTEDASKENFAMFDALRKTPKNRPKS